MNYLDICYQKKKERIKNKIEFLHKDRSDWDYRFLYSKCFWEKNVHMEKKSSEVQISWNREREKKNEASGWKRQIKVHTEI